MRLRHAICLSVGLHLVISGAINGIIGRMDPSSPDTLLAHGGRDQAIEWYEENAVCRPQGS